jgi:hypothetical protein
LTNVSAIAHAGGGKKMFFLVCTPENFFNGALQI